jgi:hypothetical protein
VILSTFAPLIAALAFVCAAGGLIWLRVASDPARLSNQDLLNYHRQWYSYLKEFPPEAMPYDRNFDRIMRRFLDLDREVENRGLRH